MDGVVLQNAGNVLFRSLLLPILFLAPGIPALRARRWAARREGTPPRLQAVVYGTLLSTASLVTIYAALSLWAWKPLTADSIKFTAPVLFTLLPIHFLITAVYGLFAGEFQYNYYTGNRPRDLYDSWDFAFEQVCEQDDVLVKTTGGTWVSGRVVQHGSSTGTRDLLLSSAQLVDPADSANTTVVPENEPEVRPLYGSPGTFLVGDPPADRPEISDETERTEEVDMDAVFDDSGDTSESASEETSNYVYVNEPDIETVVLSNEADLNPEGPLGANRPGKVQAVVQSLIRDRLPSVPNLPSFIRPFGTALSVLSVIVLLGLPWISQLFTYRQALYGAFCVSFLTAVLVVYRTETVNPTLRCRASRLGINILWILVVIGAIVGVVHVAAGRPTMTVPVAEGFIAGSLLMTVHTGISETFDRTAAGFSSGLALSIVTGTAAWTELGGSQLVGQGFALVGLLLSSSLVVDRLRVGTPSAYERWSKVLQYVFCWGFVVLFTALLAAPPVYVVTLEAIIYTLVLGLLSTLLLWWLNRAIGRSETQSEEE